MTSLTSLISGSGIAHAQLSVQRKDPWLSVTLKEISLVTDKVLITSHVLADSE